jgi:DNA-binding response OmpR family regulator
MLSQRFNAPYNRRRALIIDDDPDTGELVGLVLRYEGYEVDLAYDGRQGLEHAMVILDVMMPGVDGWSVLRQLREVSAVPVVIMTAAASAVEERLSRNLGADDFIVKPFMPRDLASRVARVIA